MAATVTSIHLPGACSMLLPWKGEIGNPVPPVDGRGAPCVRFLDRVVASSSGACMHASAQVWQRGSRQPLHPAAIMLRRLHMQQVTSDVDAHAGQRQVVEVHQRQGGAAVEARHQLPKVGGAVGDDVGAERRTATQTSALSCKISDIDVVFVDQSARQAVWSTSILFAAVLPTVEGVVGNLRAGGICNGQGGGTRNIGHTDSCKRRVLLTHAGGCLRLG
jgi:hypothetical protein